MRTSSGLPACYAIVLVWLLLVVASGSAAAQLAGPHWSERLSAIDQTDWHLIWTRHLNANLGTVQEAERKEAIRSFQKSAGHRQTGVLDPADRRLLARNAGIRQTLTGFVVQRDQASWIEIGLPRGMLSEGTSLPAGEHGTLWQSGDHQFRVSSFLYSAQSVTGVYDKLCCRANRSITYRGVTAAYFILEGNDTDRQRTFHIHARKIGDNVAGVSISFPTRDKKELDHVVAAISSTLAPTEAAAVGGWSAVAPGPSGPPIQKPIVPLRPIPVAPLRSTSGPN